MSDKELKELMSIICEGQDREQRRKVENFIEYQVQLIDSLDKEIERLNKEKEDLQQRFNYLMEAHKICDEDNERLDNRINKVIDYINKILRDGYEIDKTKLIKVLDMLKGVDKE